MSRIGNVKSNITSALSNNLNKITRGNSFLKNVILISGGTVFAHVIVLFISPIITRLYSAEDFGTFQQYQSVVGFLVIAAGLRYEMAILIPESDEDSFALTVLSVIINVCMFILILILCSILTYFHIAIHFIKGLKTFMWFLPFALLGASLYQTLTYYIIRMKVFSMVGYTKIIQYTGLGAMQIYGGYKFIKPLGLFLGDIVSKFLGISTLFRTIFKKNTEITKSVTWQRIRQNARRYKKYPLISAPGSLVNVAGFAIPSLLIGDLFGLTVLGYYALVDRCFSAPSVLIGQSISQVYMADVGRISQTDPEQLKKTFFNLIKKLAMIAIVPLLIGAIIAPWAFQLVFGHGWREAGIYFAILAPMQFIGFIAWPLTPTLTLLEKQNWQLYWEIFRLFLTCSVLYVLNCYHADARIAIAGYSAAMFIGYTLHLFLSYRAINICIEKKQQVTNG